MSQEMKLELYVEKTLEEEVDRSIKNPKDTKVRNKIVIKGITEK